MGSDLASRARLVSAAGWRLLFLVLLVAALVQLLPDHHYFAALLTVLAMALTLLDLCRLVLGALAPPIETTVPTRIDDAVALAAQAALIDAISVTLFLVEGNGRIAFMNRAARQFAGGEVGLLANIPLLGPVAAAAILALPVGGRQLVALGDGRSALVWIGAIEGPRSVRQRLISLQPVVGELDAVQVGAWHGMARVLAHEMMNSLVPIASMSESLAELDREKVDPRAAEALTTIARRSRHLMDFVDRYRAIVELPAPNRIALRPTDLLVQIEAIMRADLANRGVALTTEAASDDRPLSADPALLEQAAINLVKNAAEAVAGVAEPAIRVAMVRDTSGLTIRVDDNGAGIEDALVEDLFIPFFTTKPKGGGIGLALARQIALGHGGSLSATRLVPGGMRFELFVPE